MNRNTNNPISQPLAIEVSAVQEINRRHVEMAGYIREGSMDSRALEEVRVNQYAMAVAEARRAVERVLNLQIAAMENALAARPMDALDELREMIGMPQTTIEKDL